MTTYSLPAFCLLLTVLSSSEATHFPGLQIITDCVETKCGVRMRSCLKANQWELAHNAKGCIGRDCKHALKLCLKQIPKDVFAYVKPVVETIEMYADVGLDILSDSYLECWLRTENGTQLMDCVLDDLLEKMHPFINLFGSTLFSDPAYMACWIVHTVRTIVALGIKVAEDKAYNIQLELNQLMEAHANLYEHLRCFVIKQTDEECLNMWNRVLGTPSWMKQRSKDFLVDLFNSLISVSMKCRRS